MEEKNREKRKSREERDLMLHRDESSRAEIKEGMLPFLYSVKENKR